MTYDMYRECSAALLRIAEDWTDTILTLESGPRAVDHKVSVQIATSSARYFAHPMLPFEQVTTHMSLLAVAVSNLDRWINHGTWDGEDDMALGARTEVERLDFLRGEVDWCLFILLRACEPCTDCFRHRSFDDWNGKQTGQVRCSEHLAEYRLRREQMGLVR